MSSPGKAPAWVERVLDRVDREPASRITDARLRELQVDPARARRYFQRHFGMTFQAYCRSRRLGNALQQIRAGKPLDDVVLGHGFESHSGFRSAFGKRFGSAPGAMRGQETLVVTWIESPLGPLLAAATDSHLVLLEFTERRMLDAQFATLRRHFHRPIVPGENAVLLCLKKELGEYFSGKRTAFTVPVNVPGSAFQERVWKELRRIPYGGAISYEQLARRIGSPRARRAVGRTNGLNRIAIVIPCHRVIAKDGSLAGYGGGIWRKRALLDLERGERTFAGTASAPDGQPLP
jgi:AraC family transcriptional regulator of adaptative response/methylated-DNA-[protein]-cysteine methyltransferase